MFSGPSAYAESVDTAMMFIIVTSILLLVGITIAMVYFVFRYSKKRNPVATQIEGNITLEIIWIVIPAIIVLTMFWYGYEGFGELRSKTNSAHTVQVTGKMWKWDYKYENGSSADTLFIPVDEVTKLELRSMDVNHSFYIPAFRIKEDVIGSRTTYIILEPKEVGTFTIACAEYCGLEHWNMYSTLVVLPKAKFNNWLQVTTPKSNIPQSAKPDSTVSGDSAKPALN